MQSPYNDRWERTKRYLQRSLFVNPRFQLSPIPEEERSSPDSDGSLPDLIVEPAPDRHDDSPDFYDGLERRMKRYYRQLFLDNNRTDDEDSSDFEVNRSMASTFMNNVGTRKDSIETKHSPSLAHDSDLEFCITNEKQLNKPRYESEKDDFSVRHTHSDKLIETFETYNEASHISIDDSNKSSTEEEDNIHSIESRSKSNENESVKSCDYNENDNDNGHSTSDDELNLDDFNTSKRLEESEVIETKSISEDSTQECHRISTTNVEIHEPPARGFVQIDNGSPVLISRLLQLGRTVFGNNAITRLSGQSINVLETCGDNKAIHENIHQPQTHTAEELYKQDIPQEESETDVQRLLSASELTSISLDKTLNTEVLSVKETKNQTNAVDKTNDVNIEHTVENDIENEDSGNLKAGQDITDIQGTTIDWNKDGVDDDEDGFDNALRKAVFARNFILQSSDEDSFYGKEPIAHSSGKSINEDFESVEVMREARESGGNVSWHGEADQESLALAFEAKTSAEKLDDISSDSTNINASLHETETEMSAEKHSSNPHNDARIIDDFWSVSSIQVDIDDLSKESGSNKRRSDSSDATCKRQKIDVSMQTSSDENANWENVRKEFFVGAPLVFRLCSCQNHVCS